MKIRNSAAGGKRRGNTIIAIVVGVLALTFFAFAIVYYLFTLVPNAVKAVYEALFGGGAPVAGATASATMQPIDCSGAKIPKIYLPVIKQAAARYLDGDEAKLIAVISFESDFSAADISNTGAVGLGQWVVDDKTWDAQKNGPFKGLLIKVVPRVDRLHITETEKQSFRVTYPQEGRLQPEPNILATAYDLKKDLKLKNGDFRLAYAEVYNAEGAPKQYQNADKMMAIYNKITGDGGCKALKDTPGKLGEDLRKLQTAGH